MRSHLPALLALGSFFGTCQNPSFGQVPVAPLSTSIVNSPVSPELPRDVPHPPIVSESARLVDNWNRLRPDSYVPLSVEDLATRNSLIRQYEMIWRALWDVPMVPEKDANRDAWDEYLDHARTGLSAVVRLRSTPEANAKAQKSRRFGSLYARFGTGVLQLIYAIDHAAKEKDEGEFQAHLQTLSMRVGDIRQAFTSLKQREAEFKTQSEFIAAQVRKERETGLNLTVHHAPSKFDEPQPVALGPQTQAALSVIQFLGARIMEAKTPAEANLYALQMQLATNDAAQLGEIVGSRFDLEGAMKCALLSNSLHQLAGAAYLRADELAGGTSLGNDRRFLMAGTARQSIEMAQLFLVLGG